MTSQLPIDSLIMETNLADDKTSSGGVTSETADLSATLLERRKRLHELADEINKWEDESNKKGFHLSNSSASQSCVNTPNPTPTSSSIPPPPPLAPLLNFDIFNKLTPSSHNFYSPKKAHNLNNSQNKSPMLTPLNHHLAANLSGNKENKSPLKRKMETTSHQMTTPSNNEILNVANRILNKRNSNSGSQANDNQPNGGSGSSSGGGSSSSSVVKNIKSKFEAMSSTASNQPSTDQTDDSSIQMTPKLIIKKFEAMLRDGTPLNGATNPATNGSQQLQTATTAMPPTNHSASSHNSASKKFNDETNTPSISSSVSASAINSSSSSGSNNNKPLTKTSSASLKNQSTEATHEFKTIRLTPVTSTSKPTETSKTERKDSLENSVCINTEHIKPKSIIEKFEQLVKNGNNNNNPTPANQAPPPPPPPIRPPTPTMTAQLTVNSISKTYKDNNMTSTLNNMHSHSYGAVSLTYVSSMVSSITVSASPNMDEKLKDLENDEANDNEPIYKNIEFKQQFDNMSEEEAIYEELNMESGGACCGAISSTKQDTDTDSNKEITSLFEGSSETDEPESTTPSDEAETTTTTQPTTRDTYSICSSYTGSVINQEFDDITDEPDTTTDVYEYYNEDELDETETTCSKYETDEPNCKSETISVDGKNVISSSSSSYSHSIDTATVATTTTMPTVSTATSASIDTNVCDTISNEALYSIKEYRKQKKTAASGSCRRSSIVNRSTTTTATATKDGQHKTKSNTKSNDQSALPSGTDSVNDEQAKRKYSERIKELEELIKQEDNVIHQTGIALERCLTDTHFTGSSEHIECNRLLLISCQKRQAFLTEINRLKQLISNPNKKPQGVAASTILRSMTMSSQNDEYFSLSTAAGASSSSSVVADASADSISEISPSDLTGLLIFSDIQLPIKESYLNRLKSCEEKRIFYFLCLIRNGIQVLQTQVISVQELIGTRDTSITFPNRMAISNVDINFRVKIDVYTLEVVPKETKYNKSVASNATSKFFSPFKSSVFNSNHSNGNGSDKYNSNHNSASTHSNHHYNEHSTLGMISGGAKTSNFIHVDTIEITINDINNNRFKLSISSLSIPLTGVLFVNVRCMPSKSIELKGFMSVLEDATGYRSWDRRWCFLNNYNISYWRYPEDEYRNSPLGVINLTRCLNDRVYLLPRDICARKYTIELLISESDASIDNKESDTSSTKSSDLNDKYNSRRYRLSADTKDQANDWITNINYALANLRLWNTRGARQIRKN